MNSDKPQAETDRPAAREPRRADARLRGSADARRDPSKLRENQQRLGVDTQHKTAAMKKGHRGTFP